MTSPEPSPYKPIIHRSMHGFTDPTRWYACTEPERPVDEDTIFERHCRLCCIKMAMEAKRLGAEYIFAMGTKTPMLIKDVLARLAGAEDP